MKESKKFNATQYQLQSFASQAIFNDTGWLLDAPGEQTPSLIRAIYNEKQLLLRSPDLGLYKYAGWLPVQRHIEGSSAPITYQSRELAKHLGLKRLYITFSGWWPEKEALMETCSFKETEAYSVCGRLSNSEKRVLVVASAGNTARSFAKVCSDNYIPLLLCMPEDNIDALWFSEPLNDCVKLIVSAKGSDYFDAIHLSNLVCQNEKFFPEGGARNVARRDGMGTTMLSATTTIGEIPELYFQAIGSGTGAIAAWEANLRLIGDGRFGNRIMKLMVSQNAPFLPIYNAWKAATRQLPPLDEETARKQVSQIMAKVLSNRKPPYSVAGGLYDALSNSNGDVIEISNQEANDAARLFFNTEGIDIHPAAAVATASLIRCVANETIDKQSLIMLNVTGGGEGKFRQNRKLFFLKPTLVFGFNPENDEVISKAGSLF
ncbi:MAG TPA: cysteate synthase [Bacteroidales bacterium]|nr:cysteate synthase [Bacteroidales bacterium]